MLPSSWGKDMDFYFDLDGVGDMEMDGDVDVDGDCLLLYT
jgi:hypothetical protein